MRRFWVWARSIAVVGSVGVFCSVISCTLTVDTSALSNKACGAGKKGCRVDGKDTCVQKDDPKYGCGSETTCLSCGSLGLQHVKTARCDVIKGTCAVAACEDNYKHCMGDESGGCETPINSDVNNCGQCGRRCPTSSPNGSPACILGQCTVSCMQGFFDCNRMPGDGCECMNGCAGTACAPP